MFGANPAFRIRTLESLAWAPSGRVEIALRRIGRPIDGQQVAQLVGKCSAFFIGPRVSPGAPSLRKRNDMINLNGTCLAHIFQVREHHHLAREWVGPRSCQHIVRAAALPGGSYRPFVSVAKQYIVALIAAVAVDV